ncbi:MAG: PspC domain-containing protein [Chloroflexi bacterium]|nr:PspC domain-containing protein [Chloroflexota bacterium]
MAVNVGRGRLRRSRRDSMLFGVCGVLGEYFGLDSTLVRLAFALVTLAGRAGILAYVVLAIVMPEASAATREGEAGATAGDDPPVAASTRANTKVAGGFLIGLGLLFLAHNLGLLAWFNWSVFWPLMLVVAGVAVLLGRRA